MILDQIIEKYRELELRKKFAVLFFVGLVPGACNILENGQTINDDLENAVNTRSSAEAKFQKAREQKANLPKLEEKIAFTKGELAKASKQLPDDFFIEKILQKTAMIAQDIGIELRLFDPGKGIPSGSIFKFVELPISIEIFGTYSKIASFFDRIVHLDLLVHIKDIELSLSQLEDDSEDGETRPEARGDALQVSQKQKEKREKSRILANAKMIIFRTLTRKEEAAMSSATPGQNNSINNQQNKT